MLRPKPGVACVHFKLYGACLHLCLACNRMHFPNMALDCSPRLCHVAACQVCWSGCFQRPWVAQGCRSSSKSTTPSSSSSSSASPTALCVLHCQPHAAVTWPRCLLIISYLNLSIMPRSASAYMKATPRCLQSTVDSAAGSLSNMHQLLEQVCGF